MAPERGPAASGSPARAGAQFVWRGDELSRRSPGGVPDRPAVGARSRPLPEIPASGGRVMVLIVDGEAAVRETVRRLLPRRYDLIGLPDGGEFIKTVEAYEPDLVIMDARLSGEDGFSLCRRLRARAEFRHIPVLFLTVIKEESDFLRLLEVHGNACLPKPLDALALLDTIERLLGGRS